MDIQCAEPRCGVNVNKTISYCWTDDNNDNDKVLPEVSRVGDQKYYPLAVELISSETLTHLSMNGRY